MLSHGQATLNVTANTGLFRPPEILIYSDNHSMRLLVGIVYLLLILGSFYADYRWKRWIKEHQDAREKDHESIR
jgi:hypothetical protein